MVPLTVWLSLDMSALLSSNAASVALSVPQLPDALFGDYCLMVAAFGSCALTGCISLTLHTYVMRLQILVMVHQQLLPCSTALEEWPPPLMALLSIFQVCGRHRHLTPSYMYSTAQCWGKTVPPLALGSKPGSESHLW